VPSSWHNNTPFRPFTIRVPRGGGPRAAGRGAGGMMHHLLRPGFMAWTLLAWSVLAWWTLSMRMEIASHHNFAQQLATAHDNNNNRRDTATPTTLPSPADTTSVASARAAGEAAAVDDIKVPTPVPPVLKCPECIPAAAIASSVVPVAAASAAASTTTAAMSALRAELGRANADLKEANARAAKAAAEAASTSSSLSQKKSSSVPPRAAHPGAVTFVLVATMNVNHGPRAVALLASMVGPYPKCHAQTLAKVPKMPPRYPTSHAQTLAKDPNISACPYSARRFLDPGNSAVHSLLVVVPEAEAGLYKLNAVDP
jgi:hypothetical protein